MYNSNIPSKMEVPSTAKLLKSTALAAVTAGVILVTVVMPAEYGIDPTGVGNVLGLKKMGEIKMTLADEAAAEKADAEAAQNLPLADLTVAAGRAAPLEAAPPVVKAPVQPQQQPQQVAADYRDEMKVTLTPNEGAEIKVDMKKGQSTTYVWFTDAGKANFDVHADSKELNIKYHGYEKGSATRKEGEIIAAFNGEHGWFWRNRTDKSLTVILRTNGDYSAIKRIK